MKFVTVIVVFCLLFTFLLGEEDGDCVEEDHNWVPREHCDFYQQNVVKISNSKVVAEVSFLKYK